MINVLADKHLFNIREFLPNEVDLSFFNPNQPLQEIPEGTQALLIRTETKINRNVFPHFPPSLQFIATGTAGTDHVDLSYLKNNSITFTDAAGCNAHSVAEYIATALLIWSDTKNINLNNCTVGIVGVGNAGSEVQKLLQALGIYTVGYDPPREQREPDFKSASLSELLQSDILTFHTPLEHQGAYPTFHWLNTDMIQNRRFKLIINTARGGVVDENVLLKAFKAKHVEDYILDVWENEPVFNDEIAQNAFIKTPHIAGYSIQAKYNASATIAESLAWHFSFEIPDIASLKKDNRKEMNDSLSSLSDVLRYLHPINEYHQKLTSLIGKPPKEKIWQFSRIRTKHPLRHEYPFVDCPSTLLDKFPVLKILMNHKR